MRQWNFWRRGRTYDPLHRLRQTATARLDESLHPKRLDSPGHHERQRKAQAVAPASFTDCTRSGERRNHSARNTGLDLVDVLLRSATKPAEKSQPAENNA